MTRRRIAHVLLSALTSFAMASGCLRFAVEEMPASPPEKQRPSVLVVFVTGFGDKPKDVREHRVLEPLERCVGAVDTVVVYRDAMDYLTGSFASELHRRVTSHRRYRGYDKRVLVGFSSGGTAALEYASRHPDAFDAVVLYAPFLGPAYVIKEIDAAGGLADWTPQGPEERPETLWVWLKQYAQGEVSAPPTYFLWGRHDAIAPGLSLLQGHLPPERLLVGEEGDHGWEAFDRIWPDFVRDHLEVFTSRDPLPGCRA